MEKRTKHLKRNSAAEIFGWVGTVSLLSSYGLLSFDLIPGDSLLYHSLYLLGAAGLAVVTYRHRAFQSFTVNVVFVILAMIAIVRLLVLH